MDSRLQFFLILIALVVVFLYIQQEYRVTTYMTDLKYPFAL